MTGSVLWCIGGAGLYGSPVAGAFGNDSLTGFPNYNQTGLFLAVIAGPGMLLPWSLLERWRSPWGALGMLGSSLLTAEFAIRSGRMLWGYAQDDVLLTLALISVPIGCLGGFLLLTRRPGGTRTRFVYLLVFAVAASAAAGARFVSMQSNWVSERAIDQRL